MPARSLSKPFSSGEERHGSQPASVYVCLRERKRKREREREREGGGGGGL